MFVLDVWKTPVVKVSKSVHAPHFLLFCPLFGGDPLNLSNPSFVALG